MPTTRSAREAGEAGPEGITIAKFPFLMYAGSRVEIELRIILTFAESFQ
jgi:hypothetical protein